MAVILVEGFEMIDPSVFMDATRIEYLLLGTPPDIPDDWYNGAGDDVRHVNNGGRISGNCLRFTREASMGPSWAWDTAGMLGFAFVPKQRMTVGFAMRFQKAPDTSIPLIVFRYDNGGYKDEQCALWATPDGKLFMNSANFVASFNGSITPVAIPSAMTPEATFRYTEWTYVEFTVNYAPAVPTMSLSVNGDVIFNAVANNAFRKMTGNDNKYVSSVHIINPTVGHFSGDTFWQEIDDMYLDDSNVRGPQWVVKMDNGALIANSGGMGVPPDVYDALGIGYSQGTASGDFVRYALDNLPVDVGIVTAIGLSIIATQPTTIDVTRFRFCNPDGTQIAGDKRNSVSEGQPPKCFRTVSNSAPSGLSMTGAGLNDLSVALTTLDVIV